MMERLGIRICTAVLTFLVGVLSSLSFNSVTSTGYDWLNAEVPPVLRSENFTCPTYKDREGRGRFWPSGVDEDTEVERFWASFQRAVATDHRNEVAALATYPLRVNYHDDAIEGKYRFVRNRKAFLRVYDRIFDNALKEMIANTSFLDIGATSHGIKTPRGEIWMGVYCLDKEVQCETVIKLRTIHANSVFIERE